MKNEIIKGEHPSVDDIIHVLIQQKINNSIQCGLDNIETGNFQTLTGNVDKIADSIVKNALQKLFS